jgi:hypothetical protein
MRHIRLREPRSGTVTAVWSLRLTPPPAQVFQHFCHTRSPLGKQLHTHTKASKGEDRALRQFLLHGVQWRGIHKQAPRRHGSTMAHRGERRSRGSEEQRMRPRGRPRKRGCPKGCSGNAAAAARGTLLHFNPLLYPRREQYVLPCYRVRLSRERARRLVRCCELAHASVLVFQFFMGAAPYKRVNKSSCGTWS